MKSTLEIKFGSVIHDKINTARMSESERRQAIQAMLMADTMIDAMAWITQKVEQLGALLTMTPSVKN